MNSKREEVDRTPWAQPRLTPRWPGAQGWPPAVPLQVALTGCLLAWPGSGSPGAPAWELCHAPGPVRRAATDPAEDRHTEEPTWEGKARGSQRGSRKNLEEPLSHLVSGAELWPLPCLRLPRRAQCGDGGRGRGWAGWGDTTRRSSPRQGCPRAHVPIALLPAPASHPSRGDPWCHLRQPAAPLGPHTPASRPAESWACHSPRATWASTSHPPLLCSLFPVSSRLLSP